MKFSFTVTFMLFLISCSGAPIVIGYSLEPTSVKDGERTIKSSGLYREGDYCITVSLIDPNAKLSWEMSDLKQYEIPSGIDIKYRIEIPVTNFVYESSFIASSDNYLIPTYDKRESFQQINLNVDNIPDYRAEVFVSVIFFGHENQLRELSYKLSVSEWGCK